MVAPVDLLKGRLRITPLIYSVFGKIIKVIIFVHLVLAPIYRVTFWIKPFPVLFLLC